MKGERLCGEKPDSNGMATSFFSVPDSEVPNPCLRDRAKFDDVAVSFWVNWTLFDY